MVRANMIGLGLAISLAATTASAHEMGFLVYSDAASGQLRIDFDWSMAHGLHHSMPGLPGLADDGLNFEEVVADVHEPHSAPHRFPITLGAKVQVVFTAFDPGIYAVNPLDTSTLLNTPGGSINLGTGGSDFAKTVIFGADINAPGFDPMMHEQHLSFYLRDTTGVHGDSEVYTLSLHLVPAPGAVSLAGLGLLASARRRR